MRTYFFAVLTILLVSCQNESTSENPVEVATEQSTPVSPTDDTPPPTPPAEGPVAQTHTTASGRTVPVNNNDYIDLKIAGGKVPKGERICVDVYANRFQDVMSMQYTIKWDPAVIELAAVGKFQLEDLSTNNFGGHKAGEGILTFSWYDQDIQGVSAPDGVSIYQLCFNGIGAPGSSTKLEFAEDPVPFEISNKNGEIIRFDHAGGTISITE